MPRFSICHTTARPRGWQESYLSFYRGAGSSAGLSSYEYILCMDKRWGFTDSDALWAAEEGITVVWNEGRKCMVDGYDAAVKASKGDVIILNSDDMRAPLDWGRELREVLHAYHRLDDFVVQVSSDTEADSRDLMVLQILSRARYECLGYALYPAYDGICADDEFSEHARLDGVVINAKHLVFPHLHPSAGKGTTDEVYQWQNRTDAYVRGRKILEFRRSSDFTRDWVEPEATVSLGVKPPSLAVRVYGHTFDMPFLQSWTSLVASLMQRFEVRCFWGAGPIRDADWVLTVDSKAPVQPEAFTALYEAFQQPGMQNIKMVSCAVPGGSVALERSETGA